ncbi:MAG: CPBP family intramembrane metalloprotease [Oscillospiraceae bacterium]|nr:CPBP family intramembrane metalloprotease [Oscillospiraceae bacterium]
MKQIIKCLLWMALNFVLQFAVQTVMSIIRVAQGVRDDALLNSWIMDTILLSVLISNILFIGIVILAHKVKRTRLLPEGDSGAAIKGCILPCAAAFMYSAAFSLVAEGNSAMIQNSVQYFSDIQPWLGIAMMVINLLVLAPIAEELLCRRVMLDGLKQRFSPRTAVIVSSVIFGAMHILSGGVILAVGAVLMGLILGIVYEKTGSFLAAVIVHAVANLPDFVMMLLPVPDGAVRWVTAAALFAAAVVMFVLWCRSGKKRNA